MVDSTPTGAPNNTMPKKKEQEIWKCRDGKEIPVPKMEDTHLANSIRMIARNWFSSPLSRNTDIKKNKSLQKLLIEAKKRKFTIEFCPNSPYEKDSRKEYVRVVLPDPRSRLDIGFFPPDWDSRIE